MTNALDPFAAGLAGLPDPVRDRQFYAGVPARRFAAWVIDVLVVGLAALVVVPVAGVLTLGLGFAAAPVIFMGLSFLYRVATISGGSATWGMRLMGIELRRGDGTRFDAGAALAHTALYTACVVFTPVQLASACAVLLTRYRQTLPDLVLRTTAINVPED